MKKIIFIAFAAILAGFAISCQKEELVSEKTDAVQYTFNITVNELTGFDNDASTKGGGSVAYKSAWENGDKIFLFFKPSNGSLLTDTYATLTYNESAWGGQVTGPTSLGVEGTLSAVYVYKLGSDVEPEYSDTDGQWTIPTGNVFYNCQPGVEYSVSGSEISASLTLEAPKDFVRFTIYGTTGNTLTCNTVKGWNDVVIGSEMTFSNATCTGYMTGFENSGNPMYQDFYGRIVSGNSLNGKDCEFSVVKNGMVYEHTAKPKTDARSFSMSVTGTNPWTEAPDKLPGLFSVEQGRPVRFSKGNLYAKDEGTVGSPNWKWHFYDKQYAYNSLNSGSSRTALASDNEIDLFTWGYNNDKSVNPTGNDGDNVSITSGNLSKEQDWGSQIGDGNTWRTLTSAEWEYLFNTRNASTVSGTANARYAKANVNNQVGIILLPDTYSHPSGVKALTNINTSNAASADNTYNVTEWGKMETAGCVFLPAAGKREGTQVNNVGTWGYYWSSTVHTSDSNNACNVIFNSGNYVVPGGYSSRTCGISVRLVTDIK